MQLLSCSPMMTFGASMQFSHEARTFRNCILEVKDRANTPAVYFSSRAVEFQVQRKQKVHHKLDVSYKIRGPLYIIPYRHNTFTCRAFSTSGGANWVPILKSTSFALSRSLDTIQRCPSVLQFVSAVGVLAFSLWGVEALLRCRGFFMHDEKSRMKSRTGYVFVSYLQPLLLWCGVILFCRALDPLVLSTEASQAVKQRLLNFIRSFSTVLALASCVSSFIQQMQKLLGQNSESNDAQSMGFQFAGKAVYTAVWVAAVSLFMELLGFSTQKWLTAGGLGTVLLTLAGREIFTNFLSSLMIHATRPFVLSEWIQTKIEGYEVSGTVERVGWWSPTIIRGDDREAIHIPNHKFTVNIVRNLSQKTHWRVKTHIAISHLDANKISNIVADMRKVLAKNPQVEQQRLHRRVFLEYIEPENQAFMILVSCFVKTSHFEEYLGVKEGILLDLLRVISHHRARLATPIRTIQKFYTNEDRENIPFAETIITRGGAHRPLFLIETTTRLNEEKLRSHMEPHENEDQPLTSSASSDQKPTELTSEVSNSETPRKQKTPTSVESLPEFDFPVQTDLKDKQQQKVKPSSTSNSSTKSSALGLSGERGEDVAQPTTSEKQETEKNATISSSSKSAFEDNLVLGVVLDGAKRTLPIDDVMDTDVEEDELTSPQKGSGSQRKMEK